jgi:hypothetical protein
VNNLICVREFRDNAQRKRRSKTLRVLPSPCRECSPALRVRTIVAAKRITRERQAVLRACALRSVRDARALGARKSALRGHLHCRLDHYARQVMEE